MVAHPKGGVFEQLRHEVLTRYSWMPHIYSRNCGFSSTISTPSNTPIPRPTRHHPKRYPDPISRFVTVHLPDRATDKPTRDWRQLFTNSRLLDAANRLMLAINPSAISSKFWEGHAALPYNYSNPPCCRPRCISMPVSADEDLLREV